MSPSPDGFRRLSVQDDDAVELDVLRRASDGRIMVDEPTAKERTRTRATMLPGGFAFEVAFLPVAWACGKQVVDPKEIATLLVTPTATLPGTALGFCFSSRD